MTNFEASRAACVAVDDILDNMFPRFAERVVRRILFLRLENILSNSNLCDQQKKSE